MTFKGDLNKKRSTAVNNQSESSKEIVSSKLMTTIEKSVRELIEDEDEFKQLCQRMVLITDQVLMI